MDEIRTTRVVVVDAKGAPRIILEAAGGKGPSLVMQDDQGVERARLELEDGAMAAAKMVLTGALGGPSAVIFAHADGGVGLELMRVNGVPLLTLDVEAGLDARPSLTLFNPSEPIVLNAEGKPQLLTPLFWVNATESGEAYAEFWDNTGHPVARLP